MLTQARLRELVHYNPETGDFVWTVLRGGGQPIGSVAGNLDRRGYRLISIDGRPYRSGRLAWLYMTGAFPKETIDHKNRERADDRWSNLREATHGQNQRNTKRYQNNKSGFKGVHFSNGKWRAVISCDGRNRHLGYFNEETLAYAAYLEAAIAHHGEFAVVAVR